MAEIIETLDGHHEPQEELAFARVLERIERPDPVIVEFGCFWAYYSTWFLRSFPGGTVHHVPVRSVPSLVADHDLDRIDVLHLDIQGAELAVLESCRALIGDGRIHFVVVSTHHHTISGDPQTHQRCIDLVRELGGHVVAEHTVLESFSGDGLVVASFDDADRDFRIELSRARTTQALFPSGEQELERFRVAYEELRTRLD